MPLIRCIAILFGLSMIACESPSEKISRLQRETLSALGSQDYFEIKSKALSVRLPLPPDAEMAASRASKMVEINLETYSLDNETLNTEDRKRLDDLSGQLNEIVQRGKGAFFDPNNCVLTEVLKENSDPAFIRVLLQKIPGYYAEVERRWQIPSRSQARNAALQSMLVLDLLDKMGEDAFLARLAVKDFIGLCQSTALEY